MLRSDFEHIPQDLSFYKGYTAHGSATTLTDAVRTLILLQYRILLGNLKSWHSPVPRLLLVSTHFYLIKCSFFHWVLNNKSLYFFIHY